MKQVAIDFSQNFRDNFFKFRDDLINVLNAGNDLESGIYTAPVDIRKTEIFK